LSGPGGVGKAGKGVNAAWFKDTIWMEEMHVVLALVVAVFGESTIRGGGGAVGWMGAAGR